MNTEKLTRPEELMLYTRISVAANQMNWSSDKAAVELANAGKILFELKEESEYFEEDLAETGMTLDQANQAIRLYRAFPQILTDEFTIGANDLINMALREHKDNPCKIMLEQLLSFIETHPDFKG